jgi:hypothetical protein
LPQPVAAEGVLSHLGRQGRRDRVTVEEVVKGRVGDLPRLLVVDLAAGRGGELSHLRRHVYLTFGTGRSVPSARPISKHGFAASNRI